MSCDSLLYLVTEVSICSAFCLLCGSSAASAEQPSPSLNGSSREDGDRSLTLNVDVARMNMHGHAMQECACMSYCCFSVR